MINWNFCRVYLQLKRSVNEIASTVGYNNAIKLMTVNELGNMTSFKVGLIEFISYIVTFHYPILSCPILSYPVLTYPVLSYPVLSCPVLPVLSCPTGEMMKNNNNLY